MLHVPGGEVALGSKADTLLEVTKNFYPRAPRNRKKLLRNLMPELGEHEVKVEGFYLHKYLVTNEQYLEFVKATNRRFPFHWWKEGRKDDWSERRSEARQRFKGQKGADLLYWESYWEDLPYQIPEGAEQHPVIFVSWIDANAFAGWAGMRLPTEAEWVHAARGDDAEKAFLWGDEWQSDLLKQLKLSSTRDKVLKKVGALGEFARGAFGHEDMVGAVWEWTSETGYFPVASEASYKKELKKIKKKKAVADVEPPDYNGSDRVVKGGSYLSHSDPGQFRINTRGKAGTNEVLEAIGFRVAKSAVPARDMSRTRITVEYDSSFFGADRRPNVDDQMGIERYDLSADGRLIKDYHAISMVPVNHMGLDRKVTLDKLKEQSRERPLLVGTFITTEDIANPPLKAGMYTVYFRQKGMTKELTDALKKGSAELLAAQKAAEAAKKRKGKKKDDKKDSKKKKDDKKSATPDWRPILTRYGITEEEATVKNAHTAVNFVRIKPGSFQVTTDENLLIFRKNLGDFVAAMPVEEDLKTGSYRGASLAMGTLDSLETLTFEFGSQWSERVKSKILTFEMTVQLPEPPSMSKPWVTPKGVSQANPPRQSEKAVGDSKGN